MKGLYCIQKDTTLTFKTAAPVKWTRDHVMYNDTELFAITVRTRDERAVDFHAGVRVDGQKLMLNKEVLAYSSQTNPSITTYPNGAVFFGEVELTYTGTVINVTLANYNALRRGEVPVGYRRYNTYAVYNIVTSVYDGMPLYTYDNSGEDKEKDLLYNNIVGISHVYIRNNVATFTNTDAPFLSVLEPQMTTFVHDDDHPDDGYIDFEYVVDTRRMLAHNDHEFGEKFTLRVYSDEIEEGLYSPMELALDQWLPIKCCDPRDENMFWNTSRTTYAGKMKCRIGPFRTKGEHWFAVQCVDSHGVESIMQFFDFLVQDRAEETPEVYQASVQFLRNKGIVFSKEEPEAIVAVRNKYNLTKLMASLAAVDSNGHRYNTLMIMANPETDGYLWLDYHQGIFEDNEVVGVQTVKYYVRRVDIVNGERVYTDTEITPGAVISITRPGETAGTFVTTDYTVPSSIQHPLDWIRTDGAHLYRDANDKILVHYRSEKQQSNIDPDSEVWVGSTENTDLYNNRKYVHVWTDHKVEAKCGANTSDCTMDLLAAGDGETYGYCYFAFVESSAVTVDAVEFPDNFTLDLNGNIVKVIPEMYDTFGYLNGGHKYPCGILMMNENTNTHIKNGTVVGPFDNSVSGMRNTFLSSCRDGRSGDFVKPGEALYNIGFEGSKFCSFEKITSIGAFSYDGRTHIPAQVTRYTTSSGRMGYYDYNGVFVEDTSRVVLYPAGDAWECGVVDGDDPRVTLVTNEVNAEIGLDNLWVTPLSGSDASTFRIGKQHEFFVEFLDSNRAHLKLIKTQTHHMFKKYPGAKYVRIIGYGVSIDNDGSRELVMDGSLPFSMKGMGIWSSARYGRCLKFVDCHWEFTRSCAIMGHTPKVILYYECTWKDIAIGNGLGKLTPHLGDFEEGSYFRDGVTFRKCSLLDGIGKTTFVVGSCRNFKYVNCHLPFHGDWMVENAWFEDTEFKGGVWIRSNAEFERPMFVFKNCFNTLDIASFFYKNGYSTYRTRMKGKNLSEDPVTGKVFDKITFDNCFFYLGKEDYGVTPESFMGRRTLSPRNTCFTSNTNSTDRYKFYID